MRRLDLDDDARESDVQFTDAAEDWLAALVTLLVAVVIAAAVAAFVNLVARRLVRDQRTAGRVAGAVFWILAGVGLLVAIGRLAEPGATTTGLEAAATRLLTALPDLLIGIVVVVLGWALAVAVRTIVRQVTRRIQPVAADVLAPLSYWAILVLAILIAAEQVGIQIGLLRSILLIVLAGLVLAAAIALGLGTRPLVGEVVAGRHVERIVRAGDEIEVAGLRGTVVVIGHASVRLATADGDVEVPNGQFLAGPVRLVSTAARPTV